jgi:DNA-directed RNA polymerase specialized sigma24 family protein
MDLPVGTENSADLQAPPASPSLSDSRMEELRAEVSAMLRKRGAAQQDIPDFVQQGFLAYAERSRKTVIRDPGGYVYTSASNAFFKDCGKRNSLVYNSSCLGEPTTDAWSGRQPGNDLSYEALDCERILEKIQQRRSKKHVPVFVLVVFFGHSHEEAAQITGLQPTTVKKYIDEVRIDLKPYRSNNAGGADATDEVGGAR